MTDRDLLQRHLLCSATGLHDRGPDGRCRDCTKVLGPDDDTAWTMTIDQMRRGVWQ